MYNGVDIIWKENTSKQMNTVLLVVIFNNTSV